MSNGLQTFIWDDRATWQFPDALVDLTHIEIFERWDEFREQVRSHFLKRYSHLRLYHATKLPTNINVIDGGLRIISFDELQDEVLRRLRNMGVSEQSIQRCLEAEDYKSHIESRSHRGQSLCFAISKCHLLDLGRDFLQGSELQRVLLKSLTNVDLPGRSQIVSVDVPLNRLESDPFSRHGFVREFCCAIVLAQGAKEENSFAFDYSQDFQMIDIPPDWIANVEYFS